MCEGQSWWAGPQKPQLHAFSVMWSKDAVHVADPHSSSVLIDTMGIQNETTLTGLLRGVSEKYIKHLSRETASWQVL